MINNTAQSVGLLPTAYHALVPSFGEWGFMLLSRKPYQLPESIPVHTRFLTPEILPTLFVFPQDMKAEVTEINRLDNQALVRVFEKEWGEVVR